MRLDIDSLLAANGVNAEQNTWRRRNHVLPNIISHDNYIEIRTDSHEVQITRFEEAVLEIVVGFSFCPVWLVEQWLRRRSLVTEQTETEIILSWIDTGLVWIQNSVTGEYLRPTHLLFRLFGREPERFVDIPFNQLTHTISEQSVAFDIMTGYELSPINRAFKDLYLPKYSPMEIPEGDMEGRGTNVIREGEIKAVSFLSSLSSNEIEQIESEIRQAIERKESLTPEFEDFRRFVIVQKVGDSGSTKKDYRFHIPDLIIPVLRTDGRPNSICIEIELTDKRLNRYVETLQKYKDNNRFGHLVWLTQSASINRNLREAFRRVGGLGGTRMYIYEFEIPSPSAVYSLRR